MHPEPTVYVVDDDPSVRRILHLMLKSAEWRVQTYESGDAFLNAYDPGQSGCIVLDLRMPGMNGLEVQAELVTRGNAMPIIVVTAFSDTAMANQAMQAGAMSLVQKPVRNQQLLSLLEEAIESQTQASQRDCESQDLTPHSA